jgi:hypothetical protein
MVNSTVPLSNATQDLNNTLSNVTQAVNSTVSNATQAVNDTVSNATEAVSNATQAVNNTLSNVTAPLNGTSVSNDTGSSNSTGVSNGTSPSNGTSADNSTSPSNSTGVSNATSPSNSSNSTNGTSSSSSSGDQVNCCDFYERGAGYEFSVCDGIGAVVIPSKIGGVRDIYWAGQQPETFLGPVWTDLGNLVNNYCDNRMNQTANSTQVNTTALWSSLDLPWAEWQNDTLSTFDDVAVWLSRYTQYIGVAQSYLNSNPNATLPASVASYNPTSVDLSNVSYGDLITNYQGVYQEFINWYNLFFGADGLVAVNERSVMDGQTTVYEFSGNVTSFQGGEGAATFAVESPFSLPQQLESIAEWISSTFGSVILQNSCNLCNSQSAPASNSSSANSTVPSSNSSNSSNSTNSTGPASNVTTVNSTTPIVGNGSATEVNSTGLGNTTTSTNVTNPDNSTASDNSTSSDNSTTPVSNSTPATTSGSTTASPSSGAATTPGPQP